MSEQDALVREQLIGRLRGRGAHMPFQDAVADFPLDRINERFPGGEYSTWALLEHLRLTQHDILDYCTNPKYEPRPHPAGYWPAPDAEASADDWQMTIDVFLQELDALIAIVEDVRTDLYAPIPWGGDHTILREILIIADHNAYHVGELAIIRQVMGTWPQGRN